MENAKIAYQLGVLFEEKIISFYRESYKGKFGKSQIEVLDYMYEHSIVRGQDISEALNISKQHTSKILLKFQEMGLIDSCADISDKRAKQFHLTEQGKQYVENHITMSNIHFEEMIKKLTETEQREMVHAMQVMNTLLEKM